MGSWRRHQPLPRCVSVQHLLLRAAQDRGALNAQRGPRWVLRSPTAPRHWLSRTPPPTRSYCPAPAVVQPCRWVLVLGHPLQWARDLSRDDDNGALMSCCPLLASLSILPGVGHKPSALHVREVTVLDRHPDVTRWCVAPCCCSDLVVVTLNRMTAKVFPGFWGKLGYPRIEMVIFCRLFSLSNIQTNILWKLADWNAQRSVTCSQYRLGVPTMVAVLARK
jgi:hypothetical protein